MSLQSAAHDPAFSKQGISEPRFTKLQAVSEEKGPSLLCGQGYDLCLHHKRLGEFLNVCPLGRCGGGGGFSISSGAIKVEHQPMLPGPVRVA